MNLFCNHKWEILSETTTESKFEHTLKLVGKGKTIPHQMTCTDRKFIQVFHCTECGKLKRYVENI